MYREIGEVAKPDCRTPRGCAVGEELLKDDPHIQIGESIAADPFITQFVNDFIRAKALYEANGIVSAQERVFKELDLIDEPDFLLQLETIWSEAKRDRAKKEHDKHSRRRN